MKFVLLFITLSLAFSKHHVDVYRHNIYSKYQHTVRFDQNYTLLWKLTNSNKTVQFAIDCSTRGWVGLGFSLYGKMSPGSDFFIAYFDTKGKLSFSDRHSLAREEPKTDEELGGTNDFKMINAKEENGRQIFEFERDVVTKDRFDVPIKLDGHTNVIWAYSYVKPENIGDKLKIHNRFGSTEVTFGEPTREQPLPDRDVSKTPIQMNNYKVSDDVTQYICKNFKYSELGVKESHAVKFEPIIDNARILHHMVIYECEREVNTTISPYSCINDMPRCEMAYVWAVGAKNFFTPKTAGIRIGGSKYDNLILQIHYDNPDRERNQIDSSGIMVYSTPHFRPHDAGYLSLGVPINQLRIPPGRTHVPFENRCNNTCSKDTFYVYGYLMHMHLIGKEIESKLFRNGRELGKFENKEWDFNRQDQVRLEKEIAIHPGDQFYTKCVYNSQSRTNETRGGLPSSSEMCFNFISYYPKKNGPSHCYSNYCRPYA